MNDTDEPGRPARAADGGDALGRSEARYRALTEATGQPVWCWSPDGNTGDFAATQRWWEELTGQTPAEQGAGATGWLEAVHPDDRAAAGSAWGASLQAGTSYDVEYRVRARAGGWRYVRARGVPVRGPGGAVVEWVGTLDDVTDRRRAEAARRESEERFRGLVEQAPFSVQVFTPDGRTVGVNRAWEELWGLTLAQLADYNLLADPQLEAQGVAPLLRRAAAGEAVHIPAVRYDPEQTLPGRSRSADPPRWVSAVAYPLRDAAGRVRDVVLVHQDITPRVAAEGALRASEERYRTLVTSIDQGFCVVEVLFDGGRPIDYRFLDANPAFQQQTGLADPVGRTIRELAPGIEDRWVETYARVAVTGEPTRFTEGSEALGRWWDVFASRVGGADSRTVAILFSDVTAKRASEAERERLLREVDAERGRLDEAFRHAPAFMAVLRGPDHVFERANDRYAELVGRREVLGRSVREALPEVVGQGFIELLDGVYRTGEPFVGSGTRLVLESAGRRPEERFLDFVYQPLRDGAGAVTGILVQGVDLTDRRRAEEALRASEAEFRATFERAGVGKAQADPATGRLVRVNPKLCELLGYAADELLGLTIRDLTHPDERAEGEARFRALVEGAVDQYAVEKRYLRKGGAVVWVRVTATVVRTPDGRPVRASAIIEDVTARTQAEAALREADRKKDDFIALLAHELRNPLAPIRNGLQVVRLSQDRAVRERAQAMMDRQLAHMVRLIDDLLDVSRITRNKMELRRAPVALADVVGSAVETARPVIDGAGHELTVALPARPVPLDADLTRLSQVFSNLLTNSAKYTPPGGRIWLSAERAGDRVAVSVRDTGIGIPAASLPSIFDMFSQVDRSVERNTGGLGIGLALVKGLVEMHGGTVTAASAGEGQGSTFTVSLPVCEGAGDPAGPEREAAGGPARRLLVVDDNRDGAESLATMLELTGHEVATAHDGLEAVEVAERFRPGVILMDIGMPRLNGLDATRRIREQAWGQSVTIIALTGWGQEGDRERSRAAGCDGHLVKPVSLTDLEALLAERRPG